MAMGGSYSGYGRILIPTDILCIHVNENVITGVIELFQKGIEGFIVLVCHDEKRVLGINPRVGAKRFIHL